MEAVARAVGDGATCRNWATMTKLLAMAEGADEPVRKAPRRTSKLRMRRT
jgi:hypothetical protein